MSRLQELPEVMLQQRNALRQYHYPLHWACRVGNIENAKKLIDEGADVNSLDEILRTPLHWAAERGHSKIALSLMGFGYKFLSNANQEDKYNATPFVLASSNEHHTVVKDLRFPLQMLDIARAKAELEYKHPLHWACCIGDTEKVKELIMAGADVDSKDDIQRTPLHWAEEWGHTYCKKGNNAIKIFLIDKGADVHAQDKYSQNPYVCAILGTDRVKFVSDILCAK